LDRRGSADAGGPPARGPELARLILDTSILIAAERDRRSIDELVDDEDDVAVAAVTIAELLVGVELGDRRRRGTRERYVTRIVRTIPSEPYDLDVARAHARLLAHVRGSGRSRGAHDLIIAATALARGRSVVTADAAGFDDLPGVSAKPASRPGPVATRRSSKGGK
jgi:tRNA(fMet)-specific endonuclease VapC